MGARGKGQGATPSRRKPAPAVSLQHTASWKKKGEIAGGALFFGIWSRMRGMGFGISGFAG